jgi:hypothetical protein
LVAEQFGLDGPNDAGQQEFVADLRAAVHDSGKIPDCILGLSTLCCSGVFC